MATPDCDYGVTVDLEDGCGGLDSAQQNRGSAASDPVPSMVSFILLYYLVFMFYLIGFSNTCRWHAALGVAVGTAFLVLSCCLDLSTPPEKLSDDSRLCLGLMTLVLYYFFFMFYLVGSSEYWWHAVLGIVLVTGFLLPSFLLYEGDYVKPPDRDGSDLSTTLLGSRKS
ncbi:uncharacterized protein [Miscanthus floridulus]|uniref:uncharacterized protein n=1 Tax=Miscanthus floridulus TaxID=154761 RepID=UPI00345A6A85